MASMDNRKHDSLCIIGFQKEKEEKRDRKFIWRKYETENFSNLKKETDKL